MSSQEMLRFENVRFAYSEAPVVDGVSFSVPSARAVCIVGPNGSGKTTLCKLMLGLLKPQQGRITVMGESPHRARRRIGYLPQHLALDPHFPASVLDLVLTGRLSRTSILGYTAKDREVAHAVIQRMGLKGRETMPFTALSGGQQRRALIARALACEPDLLVMDEPTANVDPAAEDALLETLEELEKRVSVLLVSHQFNFVSRYVEHVICMHGDKHVHVHPTAEVTPERLDALYQGHVRLVQHDKNLEGAHE